jgi:hypothetical protein
MSMNNSNENIGNRTRELPAYSSVSQPTVSSRAPVVLMCYLVIANGQNVVKLRIDIICASLCSMFVVSVTIIITIIIIINMITVAFQGSREHGGLANFLCVMYSTVTYRRVRNFG